MPDRRPLCACGSGLRASLAWMPGRGKLVRACKACGPFVMHPPRAEERPVPAARASAAEARRRVEELRDERATRDIHQNRTADQ